MATSERVNVKTQRSIVRSDGTEPGLRSLSPRIPSLPNLDERGWMFCGIKQEGAE